MTPITNCHCQILSQLPESVFSYFPVSLLLSHFPCPLFVFSLLVIRQTKKFFPSFIRLLSSWPARQTRRPKTGPTLRLPPPKMLKWRVRWGTTTPGTAVATMAPSRRRATATESPKATTRKSNPRWPEVILIHGKWTEQIPPPRPSSRVIKCAFAPLMVFVYWDEIVGMMIMMIRVTTMMVMTMMTTMMKAKTSMSGRWLAEKVFFAIVPKDSFPFTEISGF